MNHDPTYAPATQEQREYFESLKTPEEMWIWFKANYSVRDRMQLFKRWFVIQPKPHLAILEEWLLLPSVHELAKITAWHSAQTHDMSNDTYEQCMMRDWAMIECYCIRRACGFLLPESFPMRRVLKRERVELEIGEENALLQVEWPKEDEVCTEPAEPEEDEDDIDNDIRAVVEEEISNLREAAIRAFEQAANAFTQRMASQMEEITN